MQILLIENREWLCEWIGDLLPECAIAVAGSGLAALQYLSGGATSPEAIVLNDHLPDIDSLDLLGAIRAEPRTAGVPLVFTSYRRAACAVAWRQGASVALHLPDEMADLVHVVQRLRGRMPAIPQQPACTYREALIA